MILDKNNNEIHEKTIVRCCHTLEEYMVIKINTIVYQAVTICQSLTIHSMNLVNSKPGILLYVYHPVLNKWVLIDALGNEWESL